MLEGTAVVSAGAMKVVSEAELSRQPLTGMRAKGLEAHRWSLALGSTVGSAVSLQVRPLLGADLRLRIEDPWRTSVLPLLLASISYRDDFRATPEQPAERDWSARVGMGTWWQWGPARLHTAVEAGADLVQQYNLPGGSRRLGLVPYAGASAGASLPVFAPLSVRLHLAGGGTFSQTLSGFRLAPYGEVGLALDFQLPLGPASG
jgi:hypothetical protein